MQTRLVLGLLLLVGCGGTTASAPGSSAPTAAPTGPQPVVLHRPASVGDTYEATISARGERQQELTVDGERARHEVAETQITLVAGVVVREVNSAGKPTLTEFTVRECTTLEDEPRVLLPPGSVLRVVAVEPPAEGSITLVGGQLNEEQQELLDMVLSTTASPMNDDDIFGSAEPHEAGDSWPVDAELAARDLSKIENLRFASEGISGMTQLVEVRDVDGVPCQRVRATLTAEGFELLNLPEGATSQSASLEMEMTAALPFDTSMRRLRSTEDMRMHMVIQLPSADGQTALMTVDSRQTRRSEIRP